MGKCKKKLNSQSLDRCVIYILPAKVNFYDPCSSSENPKIKTATATPINIQSVSLLITIAFRYDHYEYFCSQTHLTPNLAHHS